MPPAIAYVNGEFVPQSEARISIMDRGFLFADGIYEVSAVVDGRLVDNELHMARLERSVGEIELPLPRPIDQIAALMRELVEQNAVREGLVYLQVTRGGDTTRGFAFPTKITPSLVMFVEHMNFIHDPKALTGIKVKTVEDLRWGRRDIKSVGLLAQVLAKQAAVAEGCHEAWMHEDGVVTEGGSSTAFIVLGTEEDSLRIIARPNGRKILPGCTRKALLDLVRETGIAIEERTFTVEEAYSAQEAFITSATSFAMPVTEIDGRKIGNGQVGPVARRLRELYIAHARAT